MLKRTCTLHAFASGLASTRTDSWMREHLSVSEPAWSMANTNLLTNQADPLRSIVPGVVLQKIGKKGTTLLIVVSVVHDTLSNGVSARYRTAKCIPPASDENLYLCGVSRASSALVAVNNFRVSAVWVAFKESEENYVIEIDRNAMHKYSIITGLPLDEYLNLLQPVLDAGLILNRAPDEQIARFLRGSGEVSAAMKTLTRAFRSFLVRRRARERAAEMQREIDCEQQRLQLLFYHNAADEAAMCHDVQAAPSVSVEARGGPIDVTVWYESSRDMLRRNYGATSKDILIHERLRATRVHLTPLYGYRLWLRDADDTGSFWNTAYPHNLILPESFGRLVDIEFVKGIPDHVTLQDLTSLIQRNKLYPDVDERKGVALPFDPYAPHIHAITALSSRCEIAGIILFEYGDVVSGQSWSKPLPLIYITLLVVDEQLHALGIGNALYQSATNGVMYNTSVTGFVLTQAVSVGVGYEWWKTRMTFKSVEAMWFLCQTILLVQPRAQFEMNTIPCISIRFPI